jgi:hypothetical protein
MEPSLPVVLISHTNSRYVYDTRLTRSAATRIDAGTGAFAAILFLVAFAIPGKPPSPDEPAARIAEYLGDNRSPILTGDVLIAFAAAAFAWFLGNLRGYLAAAGEERLSTAAALGGMIGTAIIAAGAALQAGLVLNSAQANAELVRFGFDSYNALITIAGGGLAVAAAAAALSGARTAALPAWAVRTGLVTATLQLVTLPGLVAERGFFAAGGPMALLAFLAIAAWFIGVSLLMARRS